jgi:flagellar motility protein MotE (MotC chaperone)
MKNFLILGLLAGLLFSVSAALSLWLNQSKTQPTDAAAEKDKDKVASKGAKSGEPKETTESKGTPKVEPPAPGPERDRAATRDQQERIKLRADQLEMVVRDLQVQREATDKALREVTAELKKIPAEVGRLDALAADLKKQQAEFEAGERKQIEKIAAMYDAMSPEAAAPTLKQMADSGKVDMAAKILALMKERNAARVLEAMNDPVLALQVLERMKNFRPTPPVAAAPAPKTP